MDKVIWKYELEVTDQQMIDLPENAEILSVQVQNGKPCLWAIVIPTNKTTDTRRIQTYGTGHPIAAGWKRKFIGTYQLQNGALVFHVFELLN